MEYRAVYHHLVAAEDLPKIPRNMRERIRSAIETRLLHDPLSYGEPLRQSLKNHRKMRVGDYRIIYRIDGHDIIILKIGHRKAVYTQVFSRLPH